ncbi:MAG: hypothetical protein MJE63_17360 [Proteobacteria bacterium]|nr:hypothetical protein [Pseudomonadota bacterium]
MELLQPHTFIYIRFKITCPKYSFTHIFQSISDIESGIVGFNEGFKYLKGRTTKTRSEWQIPEPIKGHRFSEGKKKAA